MSSSFFEDDTAIAYGIGVLIAFLVLATVAYIGFSEIISGVIDIFNTKMGDASIQRGASMEYLHKMWLAVPIFVLLAGTAWAIVRALEAKGGMA